MVCLEFVVWGQIKLDAGTGIPLYRQLFDRIREEIQSGRLALGERLPPTRELAGLLGLNRTTVSAAYELLEREGLIRGHVGRGSFVDSPGRPPGSWDSLAPPAADPGAALRSETGISFATSRPAQELFPINEFRETVEEVLEDAQVADLLQLGSPFGFEPLRKHLFGELAAAGVARPSDDVLITSGCQQALDVLTRTLVQPGDLVVVEDPVYPGLRELLHRTGARLAGIPMTDAGVDLDELDQVLRRERVRLIVVTPTFQNPTGSTLPLVSRQQLLGLAASRGVGVIENDIYSALRYEGPAIPSLKELDATGDVVQLGSFSKISFPGLRVGWILAPRRVIDTCATAKQWMDLHSDQLSQAILLRFASSGRLAAHRARVIEAGAVRLAAILEACRRHLPAGTSYTRPEGGMNLWVRLPLPLDASDLARRAAQRGVTFLPGRAFAVSRVAQGNLRLSFAGLGVDQIHRGLAVLGELAAEELERSRLEPVSRPATAMV